MGTRVLETFDKHYAGAMRFQQIQTLAKSRERLVSEARRLNMDDPYEYDHFIRILLPAIEGIDEDLDALIGPEENAEAAIKKYARSYQKMLEWDIREERAFNSLKAAAGGLGLSAIGGALTGVTYLLAGPGDTYVVFTGLMLAGLFGVGYSFLYWTPIIIRQLYLLFRKRSSST